MSSYARQLYESLPSIEDASNAAAGAAGAATEAVKSAAGSAADYGNQAVQAVVDSGQGAVDTGKGLLAGALDVGNEVVDVGAESVGWDWIVDEDIGQTEQGTAPETVVDVPAQEEAPPQVDDSVYKDQIDNESPYVPGHSSCSPTSFTMALIALHGGDEASVRAQTVALLEEVGGKTDYEQTEELIIELLQKTDWAKAYADHREFFWGGWLTGDKNVKAGNYYKDPYAQQYLASKYTGASLDGAEFTNIKKQSDWDEVQATLEAGGQATAEGDFTEAGHVVQITEVDGSGITINDPYGCWMGGYISNGSFAPPMGPTEEAVFERRTSKNPRLITIAESGERYDAWGEANFYSHAEAESLNLGKWVSLLS